MLIRQFYQEQESIVYFVFDAQLRKKKQKMFTKRKTMDLNTTMGPKLYELVPLAF